MTIDVLICSLNKGIVKLDDFLLPAIKDVRYIISFQYTDERYLELIPQSLLERQDVEFYKYRGQGLSNNRNQALTHARADLLMYADDDTLINADTFKTILTAFEKHPTIDVGLFQVSSYTGRLLKDYPREEFDVVTTPLPYHVSTIEMVFRRTSVQGIMHFDERFGLGTKFLTCGEEDIWLYDAVKSGLKLHYFPIKIVETSTMLKQSMIYVDAGVQRSLGAYNYYVHGAFAVFYCLDFAWRSAMKGYCHFFPMLRHLLEGVKYIRKTS